jgi:hypothetical protein
MKTEDMVIYGLIGIAAYYLYQNQGAALPSFSKCIFPNGTTIQIPYGNACPYDATQGGQSMPCGSLPAAGAQGPVIACS